jgi:hypothetical protein
MVGAKTFVSISKRSLGRAIFHTAENMWIHQQDWKVNNLAVTKQFFLHDNVLKIRGKIVRKRL